MSLPLLSLRLSSLLAKLQLFGEELVARVQQAVNDARHNKHAALQAHTITVQYAIATPEASAVEGESNISAQARAGSLAVHCQRAASASLPGKWCGSCHGGAATQAVAQEQQGEQAAVTGSRRSDL